MSKKKEPQDGDLVMLKDFIVNDIRQDVEVIFKRELFHEHSKNKVEVILNGRHIIVDKSKLDLV